MAEELDGMNTEAEGTDNDDEKDETDDGEGDDDDDSDDEQIKIKKPPPLGGVIYVSPACVRNCRYLTLTNKNGLFKHIFS